MTLDVHYTTGGVSAGAETIVCPATLGPDAAAGSLAAAADLAIAAACPAARWRVMDSVSVP